jgi:C_GCAxxG_C_C family probable redox protein
MRSKQDKAISSFRSGLNCAQAMVTAYSDSLNFDNKLALGISCGFGGGMGRLQETCGAATGSFMVLGIYNCNLYSDNKERKEKTYAMVQKFSKKFKVIHDGVMDCKSLINCDLKTEEGHRYAVENKLFDSICEKCITDSIGIVDRLIRK